MKRIYHDYRNWECYNNGMYILREKDLKVDYVDGCLTLFKNTKELKKQMERTIKEWHYSTQQNMTNKSMNRQAWLGQAACNIYLKATEEETRSAWWLLNDEEREKANCVADEVIKQWEDFYHEERSWDKRI